MLYDFFADGCRLGANKSRTITRPAAPLAGLPYTDISKEWIMEGVDVTALALLVLFGANWVSMENHC